MHTTPEFPAAVRAALGAHHRLTLPPGPVPAAVLVPLFRRNDRYHLLFTKRAEHLNHHSGEIAFPGGVREQDDADLLQTALRETWEEVGIAPPCVEVLGALDDVHSVHNYIVTPYVGIFPEDYPLTVNRDEIDRVIEVPLPHLLRPEIFRVEDWVWRGRHHPVHFYTYGTDEIWGMTAGIVTQFLDLVFTGRAGAVSRDEPDIAGAVTPW